MKGAAKATKTRFRKQSNAGQASTKGRISGLQDSGSALDLSSNAIMTKIDVRENFKSGSTPTAPDFFLFSLKRTKILRHGRATANLDFPCAL
jgi:hypothetical protein